MALAGLTAGVAGSLAPFPELAVEDFDRVVAVNLRGAADLVPYHATKHGVIGLTRCGAVYGGERGIRVNAVAPGIVPTNLLGPPADEPDSSASRVARARATPMGRVGTVEEIAALVAFLLSDEAAYVTGGVFPADGGASAANPFRPWQASPEAV